MVDVDENTLNGEVFTLVWKNRNNATGFIESQVSQSYGSVSSALADIGMFWDMNEIDESGLTRMSIELVFPGGHDLPDFDAGVQKRTVHYRFIGALSEEAEQESVMFLEDAESKALGFSLAAGREAIGIVKYDGDDEIGIVSIIHVRADNSAPMQRFPDADGVMPFHGFTHFPVLDDE